MLLRTRIAAVLSAIAGISALALACGTDAVGIEACRQVESARCLQAPNCGIDLSMPVHRDSPTQDIDACVRFYHEQCLHGLAAGKEPGSVQVKACVDAINTGNCDVVKHPETDTACAWLVPPAQADASVSGDDADSAADTSAADTSAAFQCPSSICIDLGTTVPLCNGQHECACAAALPDVPVNCILAGSNPNSTIAYCCQ